MDQETAVRRYLIQVLYFKVFKGSQSTLNLITDTWTQFTKVVHDAVIPTINAFGEWYASLPSDVREEIENSHN